LKRIQKVSAFFCGTGPLEKIASDNDKSFYFYCSICQGKFAIQVVKESQITLEEAQAIFDKIPLTDKKAVQAQKRRK
jgi:hypothetical protein